MVALYLEIYFCRTWTEMYAVLFRRMIFLPRQLYIVYNTKYEMS